MSRVIDPEPGAHRGSSLVGRASERAAIDTLIRGAEHGQGGSLVLTGPAGIGKSALVQYAIDVAPEFQVVRIAGVESEMAFGYAGVHQVVLPILDHVGQLPVVTLTSSRGLIGSPVPAQALRDAWHGDEDATRSGVRRMMQDAHERGHGIAVDHGYAALTILELGASRYDGALRAARRVLDDPCPRPTRRGHPRRP